MKLPHIADQDFKALARLEEDRELFARLEREHRIQLSSSHRFMIASTFITFGSHLNFLPQEPIAQASIQEIATALDSLLAVLAKQRAFDVRDPRREGYEDFLMSSQLADKQDDLRDYNFDGPDGCANYQSLGSDIGWLEALLREVREDTGGQPLVRRGSPGKDRSFIFERLASIYSSAGGDVGAGYVPALERIDSPFVGFVETICDECPPPLREYLNKGLREAIRTWYRSQKREKKLRRGLQLIDVKLS
jgi:hypothetical protein